MASPTISIKEELTESEMNIIREMKRDLIKIIPYMNRITKRRSKGSERLEINNLSCDNSHNCDHMVPTISFRNKWNEFMHNTIVNCKLRALTSQSAERVTARQDLALTEESEAIAEKISLSISNKTSEMDVSSWRKSYKESKRIKKDHVWTYK